MKLKKILLVTLVLLAILTIGAVSAADGTDFNETLTADNVDEASVDASVDDEVISESGDEEVVAASESDVVSDENSTTIPTIISANAINTYYGEPVVVDISVNGPVNGIIYTNLDNTGNYTQTLENGSCRLILNDLSLGDHVLVVNYPGDEYYEAASETCRFSVLSLNSTSGSEVIFNYTDLDFIDMYICLDEDVELISDNEGNNVMAVTVSGNGSKDDAVISISSGNFTFIKSLNQIEHSWYNEDLGGIQYGVSFGDVHFFNGLQDGDSIEFAFSYYDYTLDRQVCTLSHGNNTIRLERDDSGNEDEGSEIIIFVDEKDNFPTSGEDVEDGFVAISLPNDFVEYYVLITSGENVYFNVSLSDFDVKNVGPEEEHENYTRYVVSPIEVDFFSGLEDEDEIEIAVYNYGDERIEFKNYVIFFEEDSFRLEYRGGEGPEEDEEESFINQELIIKNKADENYTNAVVATYKNTTIRQIIIGLKDGITFLLNRSITEEDFIDGVYEVRFEDLDFTNIEDRDIIRFASFDNEGNPVDDYTRDCSIKVADDYIQFYEIDDEIFLEFYSFYGNLTTGNLNTDLMGGKPNFIEINSPNQLDDVTIEVNAGEFTQTYTIEDMAVEYDYASLGYIYTIKLNDEIIGALPQNQVITFNYLCNDANVTQNRIRQGDYVYKIITVDDITNLFLINVTDDELQDVGDVAVTFNATGNANRQSILFDLCGGYFCVYVNDTKVEGLGRLVRVDHEVELELFRLCSDEEAWPNLGLTLEDLGITENGVYNIKVTHIPDYLENPEFFLLSETEIINKNITFNSASDKEDSSLTLEKTVFDFEDDYEIEVNFTSVGAVDFDFEVFNVPEDTYVSYDEVIYLRGFNAGTYTIQITTVPDEDHNAVSFNVTVTINKLDSFFSLNDTVFDYSDDSLVAGYTLVGADECDFEIVEGPEGSAYVAFDGEEIYLHDFNAGTYIIQFTTLPDENHNEFAVNVTVIVNRIDSSIDLNDSVFDYGDSVYVPVSLTGANLINASVDGVAGIEISYGFNMDTGKLEEIIIIGLNNAGSYTLNVTTVPDDNHNSVEAIATITINKVNSTVSSTDVSFTYGQSGNSTATFTGATGINASVVDHEEAVVSVDGNVITVSGLDVGNYTLIVTTIPDENHNAVQATANITVNKADSSLTLEKTVFDFEDDYEIEVNFTSDGAVDFEFEVFNVPEDTYVSYDEVIYLRGFNAGNYTIQITTVPDDNHNAVSFNVTVNINKVDSFFSLDDTVFDYSDDSLVAGFTLVGAYECNCTIIDGPEGSAYAAFDGEGIYLHYFNAGTYIIQVTTIPDENHNEFAVNVTVTVNKINSSIDLNDSVFNYGDNIYVPVSIIGATLINANIDGVTGIEINYEISQETDKIEGITITGLNAGSYVLNVTTIVDGNHNAATKTAGLTINKLNPSVEFSANPVEYYYGENGFTSVNIIGDVELDKVIVVNHTEAVINLLSDNGIVISNLSVGSYVLSVSTKENDNYNPVTKTANITVKRPVVTNETLFEFFNSDGELISDLPELIFAGQFEDIPFYIGKPVILIGENAILNNVSFTVESDNVTIENMELNYNVYGDSVIDVAGASNFNLRNNRIAFNVNVDNAYAVRIDNSDAVFIVDNNIRVTGNNKNVDCILISDSNYTVMSNTLYVDAAENAKGINIIGTGEGDVESNNLDVRANKTAYGIDTNVTIFSLLRVTDNYLFVKAFYGVGIYDDSESIKDNKITVVGNYGVAIVVNSDNATVNNNEVVLTTTNEGSDEEIESKVDLESTGIKVNNEEVVITNNNVDSTGNSVLLKGANTKMSQNNLKGQVIVESNNNRIDENTVDSKDSHAIVITGSASGNTITTNVLSSALGKGDSAISNEGTGSNTISGNKIKPDLVIVPIADIFEGQGVVIIINAEANFTNTVSVQVGTYNTTASLVNGTGKVPIAADKLSVGNVAVIAAFAGDNQYGNGTANANFTVKAKVATKINAPAVTTTYATSKNIVVTLTDVNGNALADKTVTVVFNGAKKVLTTNAKGQVSYPIGTKLAPKTYDVSFIFDGDTEYVKASGSSKVVVKKAASKLTAKKKTFKVKKAKKYTIVLKTDKNKALSKVKVTITVKAKGKTIKQTKNTNAKGKATFNLKKLTKKGKFTATVKFAGNKFYNAATSKVKIIVKK